MADTWDEGTAGLLLSDAPPLIAETPVKDEKADKPPSRSRKSKDARTLRPAADNPVARIAVDLPLAHLDRPFDYLVPERLADQARPGVRVRVRFAGKLTDGFLIERAADSEHQGSLRYLERVVSAEQVLTGEIAGLARAVADRYAGTLADVLRLAVPQRHAGTEGGPAKDRSPEGPAGRLPRPDPGPWARYPAGPSFLNALAAGRQARAAWTALPGPAWPEEIARAAVTTASAGRGAVIVVPDARDLARVDEALAALATPAGPAHPAPGRLRHAHRRPRPRGAVPSLAGGPARRGLDRRGHQGRDVRAGAEPRPGGALGRRRRPARRAPRPVSQRAGGSRPARPPRGRGRADRRLRPHHRADAAGHGRLGAPARPRPPDAARHRAARQAGRRRQGTRQGRGRHDGAAARPGPENRQGGPHPRPRSHPGAPSRLPRRDRLRPLPYPGQVHAPDR